MCSKVVRKNGRSREIRPIPVTGLSIGASLIGWYLVIVFYNTVTSYICSDVQSYQQLTDHPCNVYPFSLVWHTFFFTAFLKFGVPTVPENVKVVDESGTEVDEDVFEDIVKDPSVGVLAIKHGAGLYVFIYFLSIFSVLAY